MRKTFFMAALIMLLSIQLFSQHKERTDANIVGHVVCCNKHLSFATVSIKGTTIGTTTDETGHYQLLNMPAGTYIVEARLMGYIPKKHEVTLINNQTVEIKFDLKEDVLGLNEVVVTGNRNETSRAESSTIVNTLSSKIFKTTQSTNLGEGLNFCPGLRMENDCQNCGFSQVRMNGMEGPYSQILINSRPVFSGLAGVYGLELIPANMIDKVEVIRGGGSALYGSNAIAGTINVILKDPITNSYEFDVSTGLIGVGVNGSGGPAADNSVNMNASLVSSDSKTGMAVFGNYRNRGYFDANDDSYSEISELKNTTIGTRLYHRFSNKTKVSLDFFNIQEERRGGDKFDEAVHEAGIAEAVEHNITNVSLTFDWLLNTTDKISVYASGQNINRDSYYGANQSLSDYGKTKDFSYATGIQYNAQFNNAKFVAGVENDGEILKDEKLGYPDYDNAVIINDTIVSVPHIPSTTIANQTTNTTGIFAQYEFTFSALQVSIGARYDHYLIRDNELGNEFDNIGNVVSPRATLKYNLTPYLQARLSYSQGYRAPQIFDEDLHIETSGSRRVIHENSPYLKQETSHSIMASLDFNKTIGKTAVGILLEGFYTSLVDPFSNEYGTPDSTGTVIYTRVNADGGAKVMGANLEINVVPTNSLIFKAGFTLQSSKYDDPQEFDERNFFRTPNDYGYFTADYQPSERWGISATGNYTGNMLVPYFGLDQSDPDAGELKNSDTFFDLGLKARFNTRLNGATLQIFAGVKNLFNSFQNDFDEGIDRDPGYIYGPLLPRTVYAGIKIGNLVNRE